MLNLNKGNKDIKRHFGILGHSVLNLCIHGCNAHLAHFH